MRRKKIRRDWSDALAKTAKEKRCRGCGRSLVDLALMGRRLETAHTIGRTYDPKHEDSRFDRYVHPDATVPLCGPQTDTGTCHQLYDARALDLTEKLTAEEIAWAKARIGADQARARIEGRQ